MKKAIALTALVLAVFCICFVGTALGGPTPVDSYYYNLQKTSPAGTVNLGATVTVTATSNDTINKVVFEWYAPGVVPPGTLDFTDPVTGSVPLTSSHVVNSLGTWTVIASFYEYEGIAYKLHGTASTSCPRHSSAGMPATDRETWIELRIG